MFSNYFKILILKINFKKLKKYIILIYFYLKIILGNKLLLNGFVEVLLTKGVEGAILPKETVNNKSREK